MSQSLPNPLYPLHEQAGAEFQPYDQTPIPSTFGQPELEYSAIRKGAGLMDLPQRGILELTGRNRLSFLNNLLTNQTWDKQASSGLAAGEGVYAFLLTRQGRILADMTVLECGDHTLLEMDGRLVEQVRKELDRYLFTEQVKLTSRIGQLHQIALHGPAALAALNEALDWPIAELVPLHIVPARLLKNDIHIWRDDPAGVSGYHVVIPTSRALEIWTKLWGIGAGAALAAGGSDRASPSHANGSDGASPSHSEDRDAASPSSRPRLRPIGWAAFNATRIEAGRPIFGIDFDSSFVPAETGQLHRAVSFTKGCYLGQEVVARMHSRGQLARQIVGIRMESDALPIAGAKVYDEQDNEVGGITSSTISPVLSGIAICLGCVKKPLIVSGSKLRVPAEGAMRQGTVVKLPFAKSVGQP